MHMVLGYGLGGHIQNAEFGFAKTFPACNQRPNGLIRMFPTGIKKQNLANYEYPVHERHKNTLNW
jgi:hypothetical protein